MSDGQTKRDLEEIDAVFDALAHASRRHILSVLSARGGEMSAKELADRFDCSWPTTTRHLRVLEHAGLVDVAIDGKRHFYRLNQSHLMKVAGKWINWFNRERS